MRAIEASSTARALPRMSHDMTQMAAHVSKDMTHVCSIYEHVCQQDDTSAYRALTLRATFSATNDVSTCCYKQRTIYYNIVTRSTHPHAKCVR